MRSKAHKAFFLFLVETVITSPAGCGSHGVCDGDIVCADIFCLYINLQLENLSLRLDFEISAMDFHQTSDSQ